MGSLLSRIFSAGEHSGETRPGDRIESFESVLLHTSGMRGSVDYEIVDRDGCAEVTEYQIRYGGDEPERVPSRKASRSVEEVLELLNDCGVLRWDGFLGPHPKGVLDGVMFTFKATVNGGRTLYASGSQNFPRHYREFTDGLYGFLREQDVE